MLARGKGMKPKNIAGVFATQHDSIECFRSTGRVDHAATISQVRLT